MVRIENDRTIYGHFQKLILDILPVYLTGGISLFGKCASDYLPERVSLLEGFIILFALRDEICIMKNGKSIDKLKRIRSMVYLRNNSIFAHGLGPVSYEDYFKFRNFVMELLKDFSDIEGINFEQYYDMVQFITLKESINIASFSK